MIIDVLKMVDSIHHAQISFEDYISYEEKLAEAFVSLSIYLEKVKEDMAELQAQESGKPIKYGKIEVDRCINQLEQAVIFIRQHTSDRNGLLESKRIPLGLILGITTFSSPYSSFFHKFIPAVICGDTFVFLPSPKAYRCSEKMFRLVEDCLSEYVQGIREKMICVNTCKVESDSVLEKLNFEYILFTGKSQTAAFIKKKIGYCHGLFETGSCAVAYVDETITDIDTVAERLVNAAFAQSGMRCIGLKNLFVQEKISKILIEKLLEYTKKVRCGDPLNPEVIVGPVLDPVALSDLDETISWLKESGYDVLAGGCIQNKIVQPTVFLNVAGTVDSVKEMYGPILCIHIVEDFRDISQIYYKRSSLNTAIFSENSENIRDFISYCNTCGTICINCGPDKRDDDLPFGGLYDENDGKEDLRTLIFALSIEQRIIYGTNMKGCTGTMSLSKI